MNSQDYYTRLITVELEHKQLFEKIEETQRQTKEMNEKLDSLLALRNKGIGAFWLASILTGTGILGTFAAIIQYVRGH